MKLLLNLMKNNLFGFFVKTFFYLLILMLSLASLALYYIIKEQQNPFFYENF